jgi:hypothetical protein
MSTVTINQEGLAIHIDRYFASRNLPARYPDVLRLKNMRIGGKPLPVKQQMDELGIKSRMTLYAWHKRIDDQV